MPTPQEELSSTHGQPDAGPWRHQPYAPRPRIQPPRTAAIAAKVMARHLDVQCAPEAEACLDQNNLELEMPQATSQDYSFPPPVAPLANESRPSVPCDSVLSAGQGGWGADVPTFDSEGFKLFGTPHIPNSSGVIDGAGLGGLFLAPAARGTVEALRNLCWVDVEEPVSSADNDQPSDRRATSRRKVAAAQMKRAGDPERKAHPKVWDSFIDLSKCPRRDRFVRPARRSSSEDGRGVPSTPVFDAVVAMLNA